jgi:hypothetical protein
MENWQIEKGVHSIEKALAEAQEAIDNCPHEDYPQQAGYFRAWVEILIVNVSSATHVYLKEKD